jgi:hypothetical protein
MSARDLFGLTLAGALRIELGMSDEDLARALAESRLLENLNQLTYSHGQATLARVLDWLQSSDYQACCVVLGLDHEVLACAVRRIARQALFDGLTVEDGKPRHRQHVLLTVTGDLFGGAAA